MSNGFRTTSDHNHVCDISLVGFTCKLGSSNCNRTHTQTVQAKPPEKGREISTRPSACAGQSSHQLLLWLLDLCIPMRSRSALNSADLPTAGPEVCRAQVLWDSRVRSYDFNERGPHRHDFPPFLVEEHATLAIDKLLSHSCG